MTDTLFRKFSASRWAIVLIVLVYIAAIPARAEEGWKMGFDPARASPEEACRGYDTIVPTEYVGVAVSSATPGSWSSFVYVCYRRWLPDGGIMPFWGIRYVCPAPLVAVPPGRCIEPEMPAPSPMGCSPEESGFSIGNPVHVASGSKQETAADLRWGPDDSQILQRTYRSYGGAFGGPGFGLAWYAGFERSFSVYPGPAGTLPLFIELVDGDGSAFRFEGSSGTYVSKRGGTIQSLDSQYRNWVRRSRSGTLEVYSLMGNDYRLVSTHQPNGLALYYKYDASLRLAAIEDGFGRSIQLAWNNGRTIEKIESDQATVRYEYEEPATVQDGNVLLSASVFSKDDTLLARTRYTYVNNGTWASRFMLAGIGHRDGVQYASYTYDEHWRVRVSEHAGAAYRHEFAYPTETSRVVVDPLGAAREYVMTRINGLERVVSISQPGGSGCAPSANKSSYSDSGLLTSRTDFAQRKTCFGYDTDRRLQTSRVEGLPAGAACPAPSAQPAAGQRKISTRWHPCWDLETAIAEPLRRTTYVYNGQPDLDGKTLACANNGKLPDGSPLAVICKEIVQPTSDPTGGLGFNAAANGAPRITAFSYNEYGQLLSRTLAGGPGTPSSITTYAYYADTSPTHTKGDLRTLTNATGQVTEYLEYNPAGFPTLIRDPRGQLTARTYDGMQRLTREATSPGSPDEEVTGYTYNDVGLLVRADLPDSNYLLYGYDPAERLTDVTDKAGNTIHYTLDGMGNRIGEETRDPNGTLTRLVTRVFDALNRLQDTTEKVK